MLNKIFLVLIGGSLGAVCRYAAGLLAVRWFGASFPWGTLVVNLVGCFLIGLAFSLAEKSAIMGPQARLFFVTGYLGALTTFSSYAMETISSLRAGTYLVAVANILLNNIVGLALVVAGIWVGRLR
jgi:fluoride exporter